MMVEVDCMFLAAPLQKLVEQHEYSETPDAGLDQVAGAAVGFCQQGQQLFQQLMPSILRNTEVEEALRQIGLELSAQSNAVQQLAMPGLEEKQRAKALQELKHTYKRLIELYADLKELESKEKTYSPYPSLDQLIRVGINLSDGHATLADVQVRLPDTISLVHSLGMDVERFSKLYSELPACHELVQKAEDPLKKLQAGAGALKLFCETQSSATNILKDALRLLGAGSVSLLPILLQCDQLRQANPLYHSLPFLEELGRASRLAEPSWILERAWSAVDQAMSFYQRELQRFRSHPLYFLCEDAWKEFSLSLDACQVLVTAADRQAPAPDQSWSTPFSQLESNCQITRGLLERSEQNPPQAKSFQALRLLIGAYHSGQTSRAHFLNGVDEFLAMQQEAAEGFEQPSGDPNDTLPADIAQTLAVHGQVLQGLREDPEANLKQAWLEIEATLPRLSELMGQLKERAGIKKPDVTTRFVLCFRCGRENGVGEKYCQGCRAVLPQISQEVSDYTDITAPTEAEIPQNLPSNLASLQQIVEQWEAEEIGDEQYFRELELQQKNVDKIRFTFEKQVENQLNQDPTFDSFAQFFLTQVGQFSQGLTVMQNSLGSPQMHAGLHQCIQAGLQLQAMNQEIQKQSNKRR
jgi:hypothetical protein